MPKGLKRGVIVREVKARICDPIAVTVEPTVVPEYIPDVAAETAYQSKVMLERDFIRQLESQGYEYLRIHHEDELVANLRTQLEKLNSKSGEPFTFSDSEWGQFFRERIADADSGIVEKTVLIQDNPVQLLRRDDGTNKNITLIDKKNIHNNRLQIMNQCEVNRETKAEYGNKYDVTILVNGLPLVHIELKRPGVSLREAFNHIDRYQYDSFWAGSGLFEYVQLFVISNGTHTKYYSNTTRRQHVDDALGKKRTKKTSKSFEFTSWWTDATNRPIADLIAFAETFFAKHSLLNVITKYCVLTSDRSLLVMRPYQIVATERILNKIRISTKDKQLGTIDAGGYLWHAPGSGKTLTSFKTAQLAAELPEVDRVLFVVDRKDLDDQTMGEYEKFSPGLMDGSTDTEELTKQLTSSVGTILGKRGSEPIVSRKITVTTIQKLANFISANKGQEPFSEHFALIFDECHQPQFEHINAAITKTFKNCNLFGFTGTPIFSENAGSGGKPGLKTAEQVFGEKLHAYTIVDAITDKNVLPFRIDYINTIKDGESTDKKVSAIDTESALLDPRRIAEVVTYILEHFDQKTKGNERYVVKGRGLQGFNSIFATASIEAACAYYSQFKVAQGNLPPGKRLRVGLIYSFAPNPETDDGFLTEEGFEPEALGEAQREFLDNAIQDFNQVYGTNHDTSSDGFQNYYRDLSAKLKNREIDIVIVVNMFLTGFDAKTLNTLWVDKDLKAHGLIQAFSRTNRILDSVKTCGNIVCFRDLEKEINDAIALFGNKSACGIATLKPFAEYYQDYADRVNDLLQSFVWADQPASEEDQKAFIASYGSILRLQNILSSFDEFEGRQILTKRQIQDYQSAYLNLYAEHRKNKSQENEEIYDDVVFEVELIKQVEIDIDNILMLVSKYRKERIFWRDKEIRAQIIRAVNSSPTMRSKKDLIKNFVDSASLDMAIDEEWAAYIAGMRDYELREIIAKERLKPKETIELLSRAFTDGQLCLTDTAIMNILPPVSRFSKDTGHEEKKREVINKLGAFFSRFFGFNEAFSAED